MDEPITYQTFFLVLVVGFLVCLGCVIHKTGWDGLSTRSSREWSRLRVKYVVSHLEPGDSKERVSSLIREVWPEDTPVHQEGEEWVFYTPVEMGARNWVLILTFDGDEKLESAKVRTHDSFHRRPSEPGVPSDIEAKASEFRQAT